MSYETWGMDDSDALFYNDLNTFGELDNSWFSDYSSPDISGGFETWGMDDSDALFYGGSPLGSFDQHPTWTNDDQFESDANIFELMGMNEDYSEMVDGSNWTKTGIFAPFYESGVGGDYYDDISSKVLAMANEGKSGPGLKDTINKLLKMLGGEARSPLGQLAQGLLAAATKRKDVKNQVITRNDARNYAKAESQGALAGRRTGLPNFSGEVRDPYSYVQAAPLIER